MSKNKELLFQSQSLKPSNTILWNNNNNNINGSININNNFSNNINPIKRSGSITFKNNSYNKNVITSPIITPNSSNFKKIKLGTNVNKSKPKTQKFSDNHFSTKTEGNQLEMNHAKNYINYLHEHLDTSYNTNNELSNKTEMIINMKKDIESEIKRNNDIYKSLILSYNDKLKANNKYKNEFINFLNQYKKQFKSISSEMNNNKKEFDGLNQKNLSLKKNIKDTEDIICFLKKALGILQNNDLTKYKEKSLKDKENKENNDINILNKELNKLIEVKNIGNKDIQNLTKINIELKEEINKLEKRINKNKRNNFDEISLGSNSKNDQKIRNKKFILDNNKKYKKGNNDYYKQLINVENNKTKDLLNKIYSFLNKKVKEKETEEVNQKKLKKNSKKEKQIKAQKKKEKKEIEIEEDFDDNIDNCQEYEEEEEIKEKGIIKKNRKQTEEQLSCALEKKSVVKNNKNNPISQTFYKNNSKVIKKIKKESDTEEKELNKEIKEIEKIIEVEKKKKEKKEEKEEKEEKEKSIKKDEELEEKSKKKKKLKLKSKEVSNSNDNVKEIEKSIDKTESKEKNKDKDKLSKNNDKSKINDKKIIESKEKSKEKITDFSKKDKEYEFSVLSDQSKKSKLFSHINQNSLSMDELSSIMSSGKTQKKLSQSQESIIDILTAPLKGSYLYTVTNKGKLLSFNITHRKFAIVDSSIIDGWTSFAPNYLKNINGSLLLNTLEGLFIVTGPNHNDLYFYSQEKNLIAQIISFKACHKFGGLLLSPSPDNTLFAIGGKNENNEVEHFSFDNDSCKSIPNLSSKRINASYTFINSKLYAIFGEENNTIECLNIKKLKNKWTKIDYKMDNDNLNKDMYINNIYGHVSLPVHDNDILIVGGKNNKKMMVLDLDEKTLDVTDMKIPFIDVVGEYLFDKEKFFNQTINEEKKDQEGKNIKQLIGMDTSGNVHLFDYNFNYIVLLIKNHIKEK